MLFFKKSADKKAWKITKHAKSKSDCLSRYFQRSFTGDDRVAWAYVTIPQAALNGETVDDWFPLSGKQGDEKEGMINLVMSFAVSIVLIHDDCSVVATMQSLQCGITCL